MKEKLYKMLGVKVKGVDEDTSTLEAIFSTEDEDRHGDIVRQNWDLKQFKKNPVILNSHNYWSATDVIGKAEKITVKNGQLEGKIKFAVEENPIAKIVFDLYKGGFLNAFSVGFIPKEFSERGEILKSELLEISAVSVPANAYALAKSAGINLKPLFKDIMKGLEDDEEIDEDLDDEEEEEGADEGLEAKKEEEVEETEEEAPEAEEDIKEGCPLGEECETEEEKEQARIDAENAIKEEEEKKKRDEEEKVEEEVKENIDKMLKLVQATGEKLKAETLREGVRADVARLLNKTIRESVKIIKNKL
jgi:HK97 family phage prohead protease